MKQQTQTHQHKDDDYFIKQSEQRLNQIHYIMTTIENKEKYARGKGRDLTSLKKRKKAFQSLEQKFKEHEKTFKSRFINDGSQSNRKFNHILTEASSFCQEIIPNISRIKTVDQHRGLDFLAIKKNYKEQSELNVEAWQTDQRYLKIKEELIQMQQDAKLPDYCKFCLINNKETLKRMNRSNQEVKETRLLFNMKDKFPPEKLKVYMEKILRKYQRLKQNQVLVPNGVGWKLLTIKSKIPQNEDDVLIKEHLLERKQPSRKTQLLKAKIQFVKQLNDEKKRMAVYEESVSQNQAIQQFKKRVFNNNSEPNLGIQQQKEYIQTEFEEYKKRLEKFKETAKNDLYQLSHLHKKNYGMNLESRVMSS
ncbi:unnamed protein product (macronuclear) [Paramecium tetraurelia]|uniref:Uncharacterized protein n=1 Tax=Paramecium tetraurelia TaxID=5888 RepID=A0EEC3_PARTE|nr:uncharacterized protein GSPATT00025985001 [Paramecium tetraurelia]CAK93641.1 unnamed protein product [Paramecium tetraurelia]|eukprot:XP_001461037.1 hypothetical protein (macronuclear) [Paramecium tetraurelia strain d4-2]